MAEWTIEALKQYQGINPCPKDFEVFWEAQKARADRCGFAYELEEAVIPDTEDVICRNLWFTAVDGVRVYAKYLRPAGESRVPVLLQFHGYKGTSPSWLEVMSYVGMGMAVLAMDCPGQGGHSGKRSVERGVSAAGNIVMGLNGDLSQLYYVRTFLDAYLLSRIAALLPEADPQRIYCAGKSQGGALALAASALNPQIRKCAVAYPFLSDYKGVWKAGYNNAAYGELHYYARWVAEPEEEEMWERLGYIDVEHLAPYIRAEVLFGSGLRDEVCPPFSHFAAYNKIRAPKHLHIYSDHGHEEIPDYDDRMIDFFLKEQTGKGGGSHAG